MAVAAQGMQLRSAHGGNLDLVARYGVSDHFDLGARLPAGALTVESRVALLRAPDESSGLDLAIAPSLAGLFLSPFDAHVYAGGLFYGLTLPLLAGINFSGGHQLVLGARVIGRARLYGRGGQPFDSVGAELLLGGSVGFVWKLTPSVRLMPELAVAGNPWGVYAYDSPYLQAGMAIIFEPGKRP